MEISLLKKIRRNIRNYRRILKSYIVSDEKYYKKKYKEKYGRELELDLNKIETFNERLIYRILNERKEIYTKLADKYLVREYVKEKIGEKYLIKLFGVYDNVDEINYDILPNEFVLKCNHNSGTVIICEDKKNLDINMVNEKLEGALAQNFYYVTREWHYKNIIPKIICEEKLKDITDYKFHCFGGKVEYIEAIYGRFTDKRFNVYNKNWELQPFTIGRPNTDDLKEKPLNFNEMIEVAEKLSAEFDYCRVDLYNNSGEIKFGEITFTPASGLDDLPIEYDKKLKKIWDKILVEEKK